MRDRKVPMLLPDGFLPAAEPCPPANPQGDPNDHQECKPTQSPVSWQNYDRSAFLPGRRSAPPPWQRVVLFIIILILGSGINFGLMQWLSIGPLQSTLSSRDQALHESSAALARSQQELEAALASLESSRTEYTALSGTLEQIRREAIAPPYIYIHAR